uniref:Uncharacterized protein n=1 Tax=Ditylum brightwellii TaxID=49249 RepID=A0A7S4W3D1_9STRA
MELSTCQHFNKPCHPTLTDRLQLLYPNCIRYSTTMGVFVSSSTCSNVDRNAFYVPDGAIQPTSEGDTSAKASEKHIERRGHLLQHHYDQVGIFQTQQHRKVSI